MFCGSRLGSFCDALFIVSRFLATADVFGSTAASEKKSERVLPPLSVKHTAAAHGHRSLFQTSGCSGVWFSHNHCRSDCFVLPLFRHIVATSHLSTSCTILPFVELLSRACAKSLKGGRILMKFDISWYFEYLSRMYVEFTHQQMNFYLFKEHINIYVKIHTYVYIAPTCLDLRPSSGSLHWTWLKLYLC